MTPEKRDELAKLAVAFAAVLPRHEAKTAVASLYNISEDAAWKLIVRGKFLIKPKPRKKERAA